MAANKRRLEPALVLLALYMCACGEEIETDPATADLAAARISLGSNGDVATDMESGYRSHLYSERDVDIYSRLGTGTYFEEGVTIVKLHAEVGDAVRAGQTLAVLDDSEVGIQVEVAQARADEAAANFTRVEELRARELVAPSEYDAALYAKRIADAELARARLDLSRTGVRAPFAGVISRRYVRQGELIKGSTAIFRITAMSPLRARVLVPEAAASSFHQGSPVALTGTTGETATARVLVVSPTVDPASGTREVIVEIGEPDGFRPGAAVVVRPVVAGEGGSQ